MNYESWSAWRIPFLCLAVVVTLFLGAVPVQADEVEDALRPTAPDIGASAISEKLFRAGTGRTTEEVVEALQTGIPQRNPIVIAGRITRGALALLGLIFFTLMIYGGSLYLTAGGNEEQVKKARHVLARAAIGGLIVIFAGAITQFLTSRLRRPVAPTPESGVTEACPQGTSYPATRVGIDFGCEEPGYTLTGFTCECSR